MNATTNTCFFVSTVFLILSVGGASAQDRPYNPLAISGQLKTETLDINVRDEKRSREIPIRVYLPAAKTPAPVVLFSHGLGGSREGYAYLGKHWAARGYIAVFLQHPGSDESVWKDVTPAQRVKAMKAAANLQNSLLRFKDVTAVLDQLELWNASSGHPLIGRLDLKRVGMSGHSFGAVTTQAVSGQRNSREGMSFTDERIKAAIALSPSSPRRGDPKQAFGGVKIPWLLMTGTKDIAPIGDTDVASRLAVFPALPAGGKYELVLEGAEHSAFSDRALPGDTEKRNPNHQRAILAISTAFWDAWLRGDAAAIAWLNGSGPRSVLEKNDRWQKK
jgi:predicted dienelactone hydrolase